MSTESTVRALSCLVVDHHEVLRRGVAAAFAATDDLAVVGEATGGRQLVELAERRRPDVVVLDLRLPDIGGLEALRTLAARGIDAAVVVYTGEDDPGLLEQALEMGVRGYVLKGSPMADLVRAVQCAARGETFVDAVLAAGVLRRHGGRPDLLSPREREVLQLLASGRTTSAVGHELFLSPATVQDYAESAMRKLEARNRVHAVALALHRRLIQSPQGPAVAV